MKSLGEALDTLYKAYRGVVEAKCRFQDVANEWAAAIERDRIVMCRPCPVMGKGSGKQWSDCPIGGLTMPGSRVDYYENDGTGFCRWCRKMERDHAPACIKPVPGTEINFEPSRLYQTVKCVKCGKEWDWPAILPAPTKPCAKCVDARAPAPPGYEFTGEWDRPRLGQYYLGLDYAGNPSRVGDGKAMAVEHRGIDPGQHIARGKRWILRKVEMPKYVDLVRRVEALECQMRPLTWAEYVGT